MKLRRHPDGPILKPNVFNDWEALNVFNCAVVHHGDLFHMLYRAQGLDYISRIGYAVSSDGISWNRLQKPVLSPASAHDARGVEDPRLTLLENRFYLAYTAYGRSGAHAEAGRGPVGTTPMFAVSDNLIDWEILGPLVEREDNKDHVLFPARIGDRYLSFHRRPPGIWLAASSDLRHWGEHRRVMMPRPGCWDGKRIGAGGPPTETEEGWLIIYHGYDDRHIYRLGTALLDRDDPTRVLKRPSLPILSPEETWEVRGDVPNVVFSCANPVVAGTLYLYYGAADRVIGLATVDLEELLQWTLRHG